MPIEKLIKRTVFVSKCQNCGDEALKEDNPPRERLCKCGQWVAFQPQSVIGPDLGLKGYK